MLNVKHICGISNRIELAAQFTTSSCDPIAARRTFVEALSNALNLLDQIDPFWLRISFSEAAQLYVQRQSELREPASKQSFLAAYGDMMQEIGVHQKAIARLGTTTVDWDAEPASYRDLGTALDAICMILDEDPDRLMKFMLENNQSHSMFVLSDIFYGLTMIVAALQPESAENRWWPAIANSSAVLSVQAAIKLSQHIIAA